MIEKDTKRLKVDICDIPKGKSFSDYPKETLFIHREAKLERDPQTGRLKRDE